MPTLYVCVCVVVRQKSTSSTDSSAACPRRIVGKIVERFLAERWIILRNNILRIIIRERWANSSSARTRTHHLINASRQPHQPPTSLHRYPPPWVASTHSHRSAFTMLFLPTADKPSFAHLRCHDQLPHKQRIDDVNVIVVSPSLSAWGQNVEAGQMQRQMINNAAAWRQYNQQMVMPRELDAYVKTTKSTEKRSEGPMPWLLLKEWET